MTLTDDSFYRRGDGRKRSECKACNVKIQREYRARNPDHYRAKQRARYHADPEHRRLLAIDYGKRNRELINARARLRKTGWTADRFARVWAEQAGRCAVCEVALVRGKLGARAAHADHDHKTGALRGILCANCNRGMGHFRDSAATLRKAAAYIEVYA